MRSKALTLTRKDEILEVSAKLFKQKGYAATTMREIADQVGMEAASMYNHIRSKDEILRDICFRVADSYEKQMDELEKAPSDPVDKLEELIRVHVRIVSNDLTGVSVANNEWKHLPEPDLTTFKKARQTYENRMAAIIRSGIKNGTLTEVNISIALYTILSAIRWIEVWYKPGQEMRTEILEDTIVKILMNGLKKVC